ncbi:ATP-binding protein [Jidongwangia harbinensis]|uniref:ATP-binding protein n=1 Tax=Jidongwangia harbinensis TaxID=2878561 RepID=UPI001CD95E39|nr:ATP-binding protein [Jidongwangia harbinensis]MCA2216967.1 ATP-binding protein [Jidongwangia harbinensis]
MALLGETLNELRWRSFAGRADEVAAFRDTLRTPGVTFVHGPGGVGKSALLDAFARTAAQDGADPVRVDARHLAFGVDGLPAPVAGERPVLLIDTYELLEPIDDWFREEYLPSLPAGGVVVIAGRRAPGPRWRADPAWRELLRVVPLGNLPPADGRAYLAAQDVPAHLHDRLLAISRGHPLTLSMLVDAVRRGASPRTLADVPDVVGALLTQMIDEVPGPRHRAALEVCAQTAVTTEALLRSMVGGEVGDVFAWLRAQPFVDECAYGLYPHDVVRDALDADLRWRDPDRYADLYRRKLAAVAERIRATPGERERLQMVALTVVLNGARSPIAAMRSLPPTMQGYADGLRDGDRAPIVALTARWQGREQAELAAYWMGCRPEAFRVFRDASGDLRGYTACLELTEADVGVDPAVDAMWRYAQKYGPPRPGEGIRAWRFFLDRDQGQRPSPSLTLFVASQMLDIILLPAGTAWSLVGAFEDADRWAPAMESLDFWAAAEAEYDVGATRFPVFAHDWRRTGVEEYVNRLHARRMGAPPRPAREDLGEPVLDRPGFTDAVRSALRHLHAPDLLRDNPLLSSRMVRRHRRAGAAPAEVLREVIERAAATLEPEPRELITRTFLRPATTQERVAATLHLSFNTYRRHRDRAVAQLTERLWDQEISGLGAPTGPSRSRSVPGAG